MCERRPYFERAVDRGQQPPVEDDPGRVENRASETTHEQRATPRPKCRSGRARPFRTSIRKRVSTNTHERSHRTAIEVPAPPARERRGAMSDSRRPVTRRSGSAGCDRSAGPPALDRERHGSRQRRVGGRRAMSNSPSAVDAADRRSCGDAVRARPRRRAGRRSVLTFGRADVARRDATRPAGRSQEHARPGMHDLIGAG